MTWLENHDKMMIKYDSNIRLRYVVVDWEEKTQKKREMGGILYQLPCYRVLSYFFVNTINEMKDKIIIDY